MQTIRNNNINSGYSNHELNTGQITDTMKIIKIEKKEIYLNTLEKYQTHKISKKQTTQNDAYIEAYNPIFETLQELNTHTHTNTHRRRQNQSSLASTRNKDTQHNRKNYPTPWRKYINK
jgi:hypothetical protein